MESDSDYRARLVNAEQQLTTLIIENAADHVAWTRLMGKRSGVRLALSYFDEDRGIEAQS